MRQVNEFTITPARTKQKNLNTLLGEFRAFQEKLIPAQLRSPTC
ncbi:MAG: hypothetical protein BMS9Abin36_0473 [Gammaproteobacteria bacterium]|nr:MAG: hypothetical protein BMS9Abin36_0473 [Gammaproteobacteria bacterium]